LPGYFFDTSALVKRYHREIGTQTVDQIFQSSQSPIRISRITPVELTSAFAIKVRTGTINRGDADSFLRQFQTDILTGRIELFSTGEPEFASAETLVKSHAFDLRLRALDAIQLAVALELWKQELVDHFVAADGVLCAVAQQKRLLVVNPEAAASPPATL
jgi:uncharacterized protein